MRRNRLKLTGRKAAVAAFALAAVSLAGKTLPPLPSEAELFGEIERAYHWQESETPVLIKAYLAEAPASALAPEAILMLADWYFYNREYSLALQYYNRLHDSAFSGDVKDGMLYRKAFALLKNGFYDEAALLLADISRSREYGENARFYLAYVDYVKGNYDDAYKAFTAIKNSGKKGGDAEYYLNQIDYLKGDYRKVASTSDRLLKGDMPPEMLAETLRVGGLAHFKTGNTSRAKSLLTQYADLTGDGAEYAALYSLASIYYDEGNHAKALPLFSAVTDFDGALAQSAWLYIGQILMQQGDTAGAALAFGKAGKEGWDNGVAETASYNYAVSNAKGSALPFADSAKAMKDFIDTYPDSQYAAGLSNYLANSYYNLRDYKSALAQIDRIARPDAAAKEARQKILYQLGIEQLKEGDTAASIRSLTEAAAGPDKTVGAEAGIWLGDADYAAKDYRGAARAYEAAVYSGQLGPNTALGCYNLGYALMKLRDYRKAEAAFKKAIDLKTLAPQQLTDARLRYADCLYYNGKYADAMGIFRDVKLDGGQEGVYARLREADLLGREGKVKDKIAILESLVESPDAGVWRPTVMKRLADTYSEMGDDRKAAALYAAMLDAENGSAGGSDVWQTYFSLASNADNLYRAGDREGALEVYRRLETSGIEDLYPTAVMGIARTSDDASETAAYAAKAATLSGLTAAELAEAQSLQAGAIAAAEGERLLAAGKAAEAEEALTQAVEAGNTENYWLARIYILLADAYSAQDKDYLSKLYIESLRDNYPGKEQDIMRMINDRLK